MIDSIVKRSLWLILILLVVAVTGCKQSPPVPNSTKNLRVVEKRKTKDGGCAAKLENGYTVFFTDKECPAAPNCVAVKYDAQGEVEEDSLTACGVKP